MYFQSEPNENDYKDPHLRSDLLSPHKQIRSRMCSNDDRFQSPRSVLGSIHINCVQPQENFSQRKVDRGVLVSPDAKSRLSFRTPVLKPVSGMIENHCFPKTEQRVDFKNNSNSKGKHVRYEFKTTNFQFSKKPKKHTRTVSQLTKESFPHEKENHYVFERPTRATEPFELKNPSDNVHVNSRQFQTQFPQRRSEQPTHPFPQYFESNILTEKKIDQNKKSDSYEQKRLTKIRSLTQLPPLAESIIFGVEREEHKQHLALDQFTKGKRLGKGHFGQVFVVKHKITGFVCALKVISKEHIRNEKVNDQIIRQLKIHSCLKHPNIIQMYGFFADQNNLYILQELCNQGQLWDLLKKKIRISQKYTAYLIKQLVEGLRYLHMNSIYHRDIKPQNVLMQHGVVKIGDFGWAVHCMGMRNTRCGTPLYLSPQIVRGESYDDRVDIWGVGVMTYELITGSIPFKIYCQQDVKNIATDEVKFPGYLLISNNAKDFILKALNKNPRYRVGLVDLIFHPFLREVHEMQYVGESQQCSAN